MNRAVIRYRALGVLETLTTEGEPVPLRGDLQRRLLAILLLHANKPTTADTLAEFLWPDDLPADLSGSIQSHVSRLRRSLGGADRLVTQPGGYCLSVEPGEVDSERFADLVEQARLLVSTDPERARQLLDEALSLWRGEPYVEFGDWEPARIESARLHELRWRAVEDRLESLIALGQAERAVPELYRVVDEQPLRERPRELLMRALAALGRRPDALRAYDDFRRLLGEELGIDPSPALAQLQVELLEGSGFDGRPDRAAVTRGPARTRLPEPASTLIGRDGLVSTVLRLLEKQRLVTLTGPGGVGKTRTALEVARQLASSYDGRVMFCELGEVSSDGAVADAVAGALGIERRGDASVAASIVDALEPERALLVIDNCEHVIDAAASLIEPIVQHAPQIRVLATSRERLAIDGEHLCPVGPLDVDAGERLFIERATAVSPDFRVDDPSRTEVSEICRRLDGVPLAIELAAARSNALSTSDIANGLDRRFGLLTAGRRTEERHRSLAAAVRWSYDLLDESERGLFDAIAVFAGSFTVEAASAVVQFDQSATTGLMSRLVERSLVARTSRDGGRFGLLETLRAYGLERLEERGDLTAVRRRHARYFVELAERMDAEVRDVDRAPRALGDLDRHFSDFRAAHLFLLADDETESSLRLCAALYWFGFTTMRTEVLAWASSAAAASPPRHPRLPAVLGSAVLGAWKRGDMQAAHALAAQGLQAAPNRRHSAARFALTQLGNLALVEGRLDEAKSLVLEALGLDLDAGDFLAASIDRSLFVLSSAYAGDPGIVDDVQRLVDETRARGHPIAECFAYYVAGEAILTSDPEQARMYLGRSLELAEALGIHFIGGIAGASAASLDARHGDPLAAARAFRRLLDHLRRAGVWAIQLTMLRTIAELLAKLGDQPNAAVLYGAVTAPGGVAAVFGEDADRLDRLKSSLSADLGAAELEQAIERGRQLDNDEIVELAAGALDRWT